MKFRGLVEIVRVVLLSLLGLLILQGPAAAQEVPDKEQKNAYLDVANDERPRCQEKYAVVHETTPSVGFNDFNGASQTIAAVGYARSQCIGSSNNRWRVEANVAHVGEQFYKADAAILGLGIDYHPTRKLPDLTITPVARIGYERVRNGGGDTQVYGGAVTVENVSTLGTAIRVGDQGQKVTIPTLQVMLAGRAEYAHRKTNITGSPLGGSLQETTFFGMIGLDGAIGKGHWRWQSTASYQTLDNSAMKGYASFTLSARPLDASYENYRLNFQVTGNIGDRGYRGILFSISFRFTESRGAAAQ